MIIGPDFHTISTAPRDGRIILVGEENAGIFAMRWDAKATNGLFPDIIGMWVALDGSFTWQDADGNGPSHWKALAQ